MKKAVSKITLIIFVAVLAVMQANFAVYAAVQPLSSFEGEGTQSNPILISTPWQLSTLAELVNSGSLESTIGQSRAYIRLTADIDLSEFRHIGGWSPIGDEMMPFTGVFDGDGHIISGLYINLNRPFGSLGLFGAISNNAVIKNLGVVDIDISGDSLFMGGIVGTAYSGRIHNSFTTGTINGTGGIGGIVGNARTYWGGQLEITNSYSSVTITGNYGSLGGIVSFAAGSINVSNTYFTGIIIGIVAGGLIGESSGITLSNNAALNISISGNNWVGAVAASSNHGLNIGNISYSGINITRAFEANGYDGMVLSADTILADGFFEGLFLSDPSWHYQDGMLPLLYVYGTNRLINGQGDGEPWFRPQEISVTGIHINKPEISLVVGDSEILEVTIEPVNATNTAVFWDSNNEGVAFVNAYGEVSAAAVGSAIITVTTESGGLTAYSIVEVVDVPNAPTNLVATPSDSEVLLSWTAPDDNGRSIIKYQISKDNGVTWLYDTANTSFTITGLSNGTRYYFRVRAINAIGAGISSDTVTATPERHINSFVITFSVANGNGQLSASIDDVPINSGDFVAEGSNVMFTAVPNANYRVSRWTDKGSVINSFQTAHTITNIASNHNITVEFEPILYTVLVNSEGTNSTGTGNYRAGDIVHISAGNPLYNRRFVNWITSSSGVVFDSAESSSTNFVMPPNDVEVTAVFEYIPPTMTGISVNPSVVNVHRGEGYVFNATAQGESISNTLLLWEVLGGIPQTMVTSGAALTVSINETASALTVRATSLVYPNMYGTATVNIIDVPIITPVVTSVEVAPITMSMNNGDNHRFTAIVTGINNPPQDVIWRVLGGSAETSISQDGILRIGINETASSLTVIATSIFDSGKSGTATITVIEPPLTKPTVSFVEVMPNRATVEIGNNFTFTAYVAGQNNPPQSVVWSVSGGTAETSIDENGILTVCVNESAENITVTATSIFDSTKYGVAIVTIPQSPVIIIPEIPSVVVNPQSATVYVGERITLAATASVTDGGALSFQWFRNNVNSNNGGTLIEGATGRTFTPPTSAVGSVYYYVIVTNTIIGAESVIGVSNPAVVTVRHFVSGGDNSNNNGGNSGGGSGSSDSDNNDSGNQSNNNSNRVNRPNVINVPSVDEETASIYTPEIVVDIMVNGRLSHAVINGSGILEIRFTDFDLMDYADESGNYVLDIEGHSYIYVSLPIGVLESGILTIRTDFGVITIPSATLQAIRRLQGDYLSLIIRCDSFSFALLDYDGEEFAYNAFNNPFLISLPHSLMDWQKSESVTVIRNGSNGNEIIPSAIYRNGYASFSTASTGSFTVYYNRRLFTDIDNHWAVNSIAFVSARGLFNGTGNGAFSPDHTMTRAMFLSVLARLDGADLQHLGTSRFADVSAGSWYSASVEWAAEIGLVTGTGNGQFSPHDPMTREQMAVVIDRYIQIRGYNFSPVANIGFFTGSADVSTWATDSVRNIHHVGITNGNPNFLLEPQGSFTRAEAAAVFVGLIEAIYTVGNYRT